MIYLLVSLAVLVVLGAVVVARWHAGPGLVRRQLAAMDAAGAMPRTADAAEWLGPRLLLRERVTGVARAAGTLPGVVVALLPGDRFHGVAFVVCIVVGTSVGSAVGMFVAASQTFPADPGPHRTAGTRGRELSDYVLPGSLRSQRTALVLTAVAVLEGVGIAVVTGAPAGLLVSLVALLALALMGLVRGMQEIVVRRPLPARDTGELRCQEVLLSETLRPMTWHATWVGWGATGFAVLSGFLSARETTLVVAVTSLVVLALLVAAVVRHARDDEASSDRRNAHRVQAVRT